MEPPAEAAPIEEPELEPKKEDVKTEEPAHAPGHSPGDVERFDLVVTKDGPFDLTLEVKPFGLIILALGDGCFATQNATAAKKAQPYDLIVKLNGETEIDAMIAEAKSCSGQVTFCIARLPLIEITIRRNGNQLGATLGSSRGSHVLDIRGFREGALQDFVATAPAHLHVACGDVILNINGVSACPEKMKNVMKTINELKIQIVRFSKVR